MLCILTSVSAFADRRGSDLFKPASNTTSPSQWNNTRSGNNFSYSRTSNQGYSSSSIYETNNNIYGTRMEKIKEKLGKPIMQFDLSGNFIKEYNSLNEASKETKISAGNISSCTSNKYKQTHGYIWKYKEVV